jgi:SRP54-type protein, GTPase domain
MSTPGDLLEALGREARSRLGTGRGADGARIYRGRSVEEIIPQIQRELGEEAIVVRRREGLTGGILGFFQRSYVEIEAMAGGARVDLYDEPASAPPPPPLPPQAQHSAPRPDLQGRYAPEPPARAAAPVAESTPSVAPPLAPPPLAPPPFYTRAPASADTAAAGAYVTAHLASLARADRSRSEYPPPLQRQAPRETLDWQAQFEELIPREPPQRYASPSPEPQRGAQPDAGERRVVAPGSYARASAGVAKSLQRYGVSEEFAAELIEGAIAHGLALAPRAGLAQAVRMTLAQRIPVAPPLPSKGAAIVVVGAGGAGKTTCCATLLGAYRRGSSLPASCATITRGEERGELELILSPQIMKPTSVRAPRALKALRSARGDGLAVIDTPHLSPSDRTGIRELARLLGAVEPERVVLALPATLGATAAAQLLAALKPLDANALVLTHADETDQIGVAVEAACRSGIAPEYMLERARGGGWKLTQMSPTGLAAKLLP